MKKLCKTCLYFEYESDPDIGMKESDGNCFRYPNAIEKFDCDWCGEWKSDTLRNQDYYKLRVDRDKSLNEVAKELNIKVVKLSEIENANYYRATKEELTKILKYYCGEC